MSFNYVFFSSSLFFFPVLSRIFYKNEDEKSNQKISRETSARANHKAHDEGGLFPLDGLRKKMLHTSTLLST